MNNEENSLPNFDVLLTDLIKSSGETNSNVLESLKARFSNDLILSMLFFLFNTWATNQRENSDTLEQDESDPAKKFFDFWYKATKKQIKKEILEINKKMKTGQLEYLGAISGYTLPSTEDYQVIYNQALKETKKMFEKNTKN